LTNDKWVKVTSNLFYTIYKTAKKAQHKMQHKHMFDCAGDIEEPTNR